MQPKFQKSFHEHILPNLLIVMDDPIPRVVAHAAAAITNFVEAMEKADV